VKLEGPELEALVERLRAGDKSAAEQVIIQAVPLARGLARKYIRFNQEKKEDIYAAAMLGLCQAVDFALQGRLKDNNIGPYINVTVRRFIRTFLEKDHLIHVPKDSWNKMIKSLNLDDMQPYDRMIALRKLKAKFLVFQGSKQKADGEFLADGRSGLAILSHDPDFLTQEEILLKMRLTRFESKLLEMRGQGMTQTEIAEHFSKSQPYINQTLKKLQARYRLVQRAYPEFPEPPEEYV